MKLKKTRRARAALGEFLASSHEGLTAEEAKTLEAALMTLVDIEYRCMGQHVPTP